MLADLQAVVGAGDGGRVSVAAECVDKRVGGVLYGVVVSLVDVGHQVAGSFAGECFDRLIAPGFPEGCECLCCQGIVVVAEEGSPLGGEPKRLGRPAATAAGFFRCYQLRVFVVDQGVEVAADTGG